ncbi:D-aminoacyl-tRNA deacylase [Propionivibrio limicola]|nr:D-aminoacyl-tRNA deacylase [Propionivibrio limicola]
MARFVGELDRELDIQVQTDVFGADMDVHLVNSGPVTIFIDSKNPD